jgi:hypothetical protein
VAQLETPPEINYLAKDYAGFRQLLLDHLSLWLPGWAEEHPADLGHALVEVLAYAADYLSYYQDAVATEAYLGTARLRRSVKRHVRLLNYPWHEGCNARVWVQVQVKDGELSLPKGTKLLTRLEGGGTEVVIQPNSPAYAEAMTQAPTVFETMLDITLHEAHNQLQFYTPPLDEWADRPYILKEGATSTELLYPEGEVELAVGKEGATSTELLYPEGEVELAVGQVLIFEETRNPQTGREEDADPRHRHAVRLTHVEPRTHDDRVVIEWGVDDAVPFDLCLAACYDGIHAEEMSVALGNIVLADHGLTIKDEELPGSPRAGRYSPHLAQAGLTFSVPFYRDRTASWSAKKMLGQEPHQAMPSLILYERTTVLPGEEGRALPILNKIDKESYLIKNWTVRSELMSSGTYERDYAVEIEGDGRAYLQFGFADVGWRPEAADASFVANYRIGNGSAGNVGRDTIGHIVTNDKRIIAVRNPLPAQGGTKRVETEEARQHAPLSYRSSPPCVTESDYARAAERHPQVAAAVAQIHWTGSRHTIYIHVQRRGDRSLDEIFRRELVEFMERFRLAGCDLEIQGVRSVPIEIALVFDLKPHHQASSVIDALQKTFSSERTLPDEKVGFFHPDCWTFGQAVYQSQVIARAMDVPGVARVAVDTFRRIGAAEKKDDPIPVGSLEIVRLHNDPGDPSQGTIKFTPR